MIVPPEVLLVEWNRDLSDELELASACGSLAWAVQAVDSKQRIVGILEAMVEELRGRTLDLRVSKPRSDSGKTIGRLEAAIHLLEEPAVVVGPVVEILRDTIRSIDEP